MPIAAILAGLGYGGLFVAGRLGSLDRASHMEVAGGIIVVAVLVTHTLLIRAHRRAVAAFVAGHMDEQLLERPHVPKRNGRPGEGDVFDLERLRGELADSLGATSKEGTIAVPLARGRTCSVSLVASQTTLHVQAVLNHLDPAAARVFWRVVDREPRPPEITAGFNNLGEGACTADVYASLPLAEATLARVEPFVVAVATLVDEIEREVSSGATPTDRKS
jgi:hypothetical protein